MKIYAHRGASGFAPENTMSAFKTALDKKADGIELDVQMTSDGEIVVIHDEEIKRTCNSCGLAMNKTLEELKSYDFGSWYSNEFVNEKIPTLTQVLDWLKTNNLLLNIEIKPAPVFYKRELTEKTIAYILERSLEDRIIISSFNHQALKDSKEICPKIKTAALLGGSILNLGEYCKAHNIDFAHPESDFTDYDLVKSCKENNIKVNVWTVNQKEDAQRLFDLGVDGIITNYPNSL